MIRVLVVEDNVELNEVVSEYLHEHFGWEVFSASTALQARALARSGPVDLVFLDVVLGDASASSVARTIREFQGNPQLPIIVMSGFHPKDLAASSHPSARGLKKEVQAIRGAAYLVKPFSLERLREAVRKVLGAVSARREEMAETTAT